MFSTSVDGYFMEWDTERAGGFEPLRLLPRDKKVVLGLVTTKSGVLESKDALRRRIDEAAKYVPLERLGLSPQCGFASTHHGNTLTQDEPHQARDGDRARPRAAPAAARQGGLDARPVQRRALSLRHRRRLAEGGDRDHGRRFRASLDADARVDPRHEGAVDEARGRVPRQVL